MWVLPSLPHTLQIFISAVLICWSWTLPSAPTLNMLSGHCLWLPPRKSVSLTLTLYKVQIILLSPVSFLCSSMTRLFGFYFEFLWEVLSVIILAGCASKRFLWCLAVRFQSSETAACHWPFLWRKLFSDFVRDVGCVICSCVVWKSIL